MSNVLFENASKKRNLATVPTVVVQTLNQLVSELAAVSLPADFIFDSLASLTSAGFVRERLQELALENAPMIRGLGLSKEKSFAMLEVPDVASVVRAAQAAERILTTLYDTEPRPSLKDVDFNKDTQQFYRGELLEEWYSKQYQIRATSPRHIQALTELEELFAAMQAFSSKYPRVPLINQDGSSLSALIVIDSMNKMSLNKIKIKDL
jgi:hypothetical protein